MESVVSYAISGLIGGLVSLAVVALKVLPYKVSRKEVEVMIEKQPLQFQYQFLAHMVEGQHMELEGIRAELVGLRQDVTKLTTTLELTLKGRM
jgi:hypothetical protein